MSEALSPAQFARLAGIRLDCVYKKLWDGSLPAQKSDDGPMGNFFLRVGEAHSEAGGIRVMDNVDDAFNKLMGSFQSEVPGLEAQIAADLAEARRRANGGLDLEPLFANLEALMFRCTRIEKRISELEAQRSATKENK